MRRGSHAVEDLGESGDLQVESGNAKVSLCVF